MLNSDSSNELFVPPFSKDISGDELTPVALNSARVLWLNWRDIKNPDAGVEEVFIHEVMQRLAKQGYEMGYTNMFRLSNSKKLRMSSP